MKMGTRSIALLVCWLLGCLAPASAVQAPSPGSELRVIDLRGTPFEIGLGHGKALKAEIAELVKR